MHYTNLKVLFTFFCLFVIGSLPAQQIAFPGAEGYGRFASGGRGDNIFLEPQVVAVTNLDDNDEGESLIEGSFRWALEQQDTLYNGITLKKPTIIIFKVGGVIKLKQDIKFKAKNLTIAGQTAPGDGICFAGGTLNFSGSENLIVRYIRSRPGDILGDEVSAFRIENGGNFIIDHCSFSWAIEETTHFSSNENTTVQWCIISESLYHSIHKKGDRGYATQWGGEYASYHHNLLAHHNSRMPRINGSNKNDIESLVDYRNNVNYNWGSTGAFYGGEWEGTDGRGFSHVNVVNNYFKTGPATSGELFARPSLNRSGVELDGYAQWYFNGNIMEGNESLTNNNWSGVDGSKVGGIDNIRSEVEFVKEDGELEQYENYTQNAEAAFESVLEDAGVTLPKRGPHDERLIKEIKGEIDIVRYEYTTTDGQDTPKKGVGSGLIDTQANLVSPEDRQDGKTAWDVYESADADQIPVDTDNDGMPDEWEEAHGLDPEDLSDFKTETPSRYLFLEVYLNELAGDTIDYNEEPTALDDYRVNVNKLNVYPNPAYSHMYIYTNIELSDIEMYNVNGKLVKKNIVSNANTPISVESLKNGFYILKGSDKKGNIYTTKVLKR
jgi:hypothetical protein